MEPSILIGPMAGTHTIRQGQRTASRVIDGKAVVITVDRNELHVLNAVGTRIWELADGRSLQDIIDTIVREFAVDRERACSDVCAFSEQLLAMGTLEMTQLGQGIA